MAEIPHSYVDTLLELTEVKYAQLKGRAKDGQETQRLELPSDQIRALLWAVGVLLDTRLDELDLEIEALWSTVEAEDEDQ